MNGMTASMRRLQSAWQALPAQRQRWVTVALGALALLLVWALAVQPAWRTLQQSRQQKAHLAAQLGEMQALATQARQLQAKPALDRSAASVQLQQAVKTHLGATAQVQSQPEQLQVTFKAAAPDKLAAFLSEIRQAGASVTSMQTTRNTSASGGWDGQISVRTPGAR